MHSGYQRESFGAVQWDVWMAMLGDDIYSVSGCSLPWWSGLQGSRNLDKNGSGYGGNA